MTWQREWDRTYRRIAPNEFQIAHSDEHDRIVDGMETGHPERASAAMQAHLRTIEAAMLGRAGPD